jgi:hypothetical protein
MNEPLFLTNQRGQKLTFKQIKSRVTAADFDGDILNIAVLEDRALTETHTHSYDGGEFYYIGESSHPINSINNSVEEDFMNGILIQERFDEFVKKNNINVDEDGNFECHLVIDESDTEHEVGTIFNNTSKVAYVTISRVYEHLKETLEMQSRYVMPLMPIKQEHLENKISITEELLKIEKKIVKVLVNQNNIIYFYPKYNTININKYKVIGFIKPEPKIALKVLEFDNEHHYVSVSLYNTITFKSNLINIKFVETDTKESIIDRIKDYLLLDEKQVQIQNKLNGQILF